MLLSFGEYQYGTQNIKYCETNNVVYIVQQEVQSVHHHPLWYIYLMYESREPEMTTYVTIFRCNSRWEKK